MLTKENVDTLLAQVRDIGKSCVLSDIHVHPYEVLYGGLVYTANPRHEGVYSVENARYQPPEIGPIPLQAPGSDFRRFPPRLREHLEVLTFRRCFAHTGPKWISDHMEICGIRKALLLPVLGPDETDIDSMGMFKKMFGDDDRFVIGYCVPNCIRDEDVSGAVRRAIGQYHVKAIKIHPNRTGIDLASREGTARVSLILEASGKNGLPVVIHGGSSEISRWDERTSSFGSARNLRHIDWGITKEPVIIAHAGAYGHDLGEIEKDIIPIIRKLLAKFDHLLVDVAGLDIPTQIMILNSIEADRILFGSDALYFLQWKAIVSLLFALKKSSPDRFEREFVTIASENPRKIFPA